MITYAVDTTKLSGADYNAGKDMHWDFGTECDSKREAIALARKWCSKDVGVRVDRLNDDDDAIAATQTVFTIFKDTGEKNYKLEYAN